VPVGASSPAHIADGVYYYGTNEAQWKVTIENGGRHIIEQTTNNMRMPSVTDLTFDPATFVVTVNSYILGGPGIHVTKDESCVGMPETCTKIPHVAFTPIPGTKHAATLDPYLLPFIVAGTGEHIFTMDATHVMHANDELCHDATPVALRNDDCLRVTWGPESLFGGAAEEIWYNPKTYVVDRYITDRNTPVDRVEGPP